MSLQSGELDGRPARNVLSTTETLGTVFRRIAEIGQLLPRRTLHGNVSAKAATWNGSLLYKTLMEHEPDHPLVREAVREVLEDQCDAPQRARRGRAHL